MIALLFAGCAALPAPQVTLSSSPTAKPTTIPVVTVEPAPSPTPTVDNSVITSNVEPGPGLAIGTVATTDGKYIYCHNLFEFNDSDKDYTKLYRFNPKTRKKEEIRVLQGDSSIRQIFTDSNGNLYYVLMSYTDYSNRLMQYLPSGDSTLAENVAEVVRVDNSYIYYHPFTKTSEEDYDRLMAYNLKDGSIAEVNNGKDIVLWQTGDNDISWDNSDGMCVVDIKNSYTKQIKTCSLPADAFNASDFDTTDSMKGYAVGNNLVLFVNAQDTRNSYTIYKIDMNQNRIVSKSKYTGEIDFYSGITAANGVVYFYSYSYKDESNVNRRIRSYRIKDGKLHDIQRLPDGDYEDGLALDVVGGYIWMGSYSHGDGTGYWDTHPVSIK